MVSHYEARVNTIVTRIVPFVLFIRYDVVLRGHGIYRFGTIRRRDNLFQRISRIRTTAVTR